MTDQKTLFGWPSGGSLRLCLLAGLALMAGCGGSGKPGSAGKGAAAGSLPLVGVSLLTLDNPFFRVIGDTLTTELAKEGFQVLVVSADKDPARQSNQVQDFLQQGARAIVLSPCEAKAMVPAIQEANRKGVPVFTVDIPCREEGVKIVCQVATDNVGGGREAANGMIEVLGKAGGKVAILHFKQAESCRLRVQGFREVIVAHNQANPGAQVEIVTELEGGAAKDLSFKATEDALQAQPGLRGIFAINDPSALGARAALEKAGKADSVVIVGFDGQPEGKKAIREGKIFADPIQFPDRLGREVATAIARHSRGEEVKPEILIPTRLYRQADAANDPEAR
ncbi:MAG: sugar ABC transporter substrate-binding protein [Planctomycetota bacterium]|nr:MAG: sugar ABC transporter substrate-binding protein [Planctomycetota bacterium]